MHVTICIVYVLKLEKDKYYVGKTKNISKRLREHMAGYRCSSWTRKFRPIALEETYHRADSLDEDKITLKYMMSHGIDNVRGGPYVSTVLPPETKVHITQRIRMASDVCVKCGSDTHFVSECPIRKCDEELPRCGKCSSQYHFTEDCAELVSNTSCPKSKKK
jgi:hypothetical protein